MMREDTPLMLQFTEATAVVPAIVIPGQMKRRWVDHRAGIVVGDVAILMCYIKETPCLPSDLDMGLGSLGCLVIPCGPDSKGNNRAALHCIYVDGPKFSLVLV